ncbi:MAG: hypothetical protein D6681_13100, partial [Calditrichaeota bacterium]
MNHRLVYFFEDIAQERFVRALVRRAIQNKEDSIEEYVLNATRGSRVWVEFRQFLWDLKQGQTPFPDVLIVVIDGNCRGHRQVQQDIMQEVWKKQVGVPAEKVVCAVPDPHIERWYLEDQRALTSILPGAHIDKPKYKCERD